MLKIKELRLEKGLTQKEFAECVNLTAHNIGDWERGKGEPSIDYLIKIAKAFNCTTDYLLGMEDDFGIKESSDNESSYTYDERQLIDIYRKLPDDRKKSMINFANDNFQLATGESYNQFLKFKKA